MTSPTGPYLRYPATARVIAKICEGFVPAVTAGARTGIRFPPSLTGLLPFVRAVRDGGRTDGITDYARISVDILDDDYARGEALAQRILHHLETGRLRHGAVILDHATCDSAVQQLPDWAPGIYRFESRFTVTARRYQST